MGHGDAQTVLFPGVLDKAVEFAFDTEETTSDGGALLLRGADLQLGLTEAMAGAIEDPRRSERVTHDVGSLVRQRMFQIAAGYVDCNDSELLREEPIFTRLKRSGRRDRSSLASQPTLSRFENGVSSRDLVRAGRALANVVLRGAQKRHGKKRVRRVTLDLDPTCDPVHGGQQLAIFHGFYDCHCYLPMGAFLSFDDHPEQHLVAAVLRSGEARDFEGAVPLLRRLLPRLRGSFDKARALVRLDGGFCTPEVLGFLDDEPRSDYAVNIQKNTVLESFPEVVAAMRRVRKRAKETGESAREYGEIEYSAEKWDTVRRVVFKAEVTMTEGRKPKDNPRFVVTNLRQSPKWVYQLYAQRGDVENRLKELKSGMAMDRTSCHRFLANQFRLLLTAGAYALMQQIRFAARGTGCARAQVDTIRLRLLKIGARVKESTRRIVLHGPKSYPWLSDFRRIARRLCAGLG